MPLITQPESVEKLIDFIKELDPSKESDYFRLRCQCLTCDDFVTCFKK